MQEVRAKAPDEYDFARLVRQACALCRPGMIVKIRVTGPWQRHMYNSRMVRLALRGRDGYAWTTTPQSEDAQAFFPAFAASTGVAFPPPGCPSVRAHARREVARTGAGAFIACTGGDMDAFGSSGRLAGVAGLAPVPRDSGRISGNMRRPHRCHRRLLRVFCLSAQIAAQSSPISKAFYDRNRAEGKSHKQVILALARRRLDVLWALIRDHRTFTTEPPHPDLTLA